jgi:hypothetical protein
MNRIGIGDGLGLDGQPWTDASTMNDDTFGQMDYEINIGDAAMQDLTSNHPANCFVIGISGTVSDVLIHEMTHVWQYFIRSGVTARERVWASAAGARAPIIGRGYDFTPGESWASYNVEQQASIVESWHSNGRLKNNPLYAYIKLVLQSRGDALDYASGLSLNELNRDLASLRARHLD